MANTYDFAYLLNRDLAAHLRICFPHVVPMDSIMLFNPLIHTSDVSTEKRLMIYMSSLCKAFDRRDIADIGSTRSGE